MAKSDIEAIDNLLDEDDAPTIKPGSGTAAVGAIQDLLRGHGYAKMPGLDSRLYGTFGPATKKALFAFRKLYLPQKPVVEEEVDKDTLLTLLAIPPINPIASQVYITRLLDVPFKGYDRLACLVAIGEGKGAFGALCLNKDKAGLSVGMIQWAQRPGRLNKLLNALNTDARPLLVLAFGTDARVTALLTHTAKTGENPKVRGGVLESGKPVANDAAMDLTLHSWPDQFTNLCRFYGVQKIQIKHAAEGFKERKALFDAVSSETKSERLVAYLLDVVNQFEKSAPDLFKKALDLGGLPAPTPNKLKDRDAIIIDRVTTEANKLLRKIGEQVKDGKQKWTEAFIVSVQKSRTTRGAFFKKWSGLRDTAFTD